MFLTKSLQFEDGGGFPFTLLAPVVYLSTIEPGKILRITVPVGFKTDLASIPRPLWNLLPPVGKYDRPAVVHDYLYQRNGVTRAQADRVLLEAMRELGVGRITRALIYSGVRVGGRWVWNSYRRRQK